MNRLVVLFMLVILILSCGAQAKVQKLAGRKIVTNPCVLIYTDALGKTTRVIRSNPLIIILK